MARQNFDIPFEAEDDGDAIDTLGAFSIAPENSEIEITLTQPHNSNILDPGRLIKTYKGRGK